MTELDRAGNLLGALSLSVADRTVEAVGDAAGQSETADTRTAAGEDATPASQAAAPAKSAATPMPTVKEPSAAAGHVTRRRSSEDARSVSVRLTPRGRRAARRVSRARGEVLNEALATLDNEEREQLEEILARVIPNMMRGPRATRWLCRLCDMEACGRADGHCPAASAARARWGS